MKAHMRRMIAMAALVGVLLLTSGCNGPWSFWGLVPPRGAVRGGPVRTEARSVEIGAAKTVRTRVSMGAGELTIAGGASALFEGSFTYDVVEWTPEVSYTVSSSAGVLTVRQPNTWRPVVESRANKWDLRLNSGVPTELDVTFGAGEGALRLAGLNLSSLSINIGAGELLLDLSGSWQRDVTVTVRGGVGRVTIRLPKEAGVRVGVRGALGSVEAENLHRSGSVWTNDAYGHAATTLNIDVEGGIGTVALEGAR